MADEEIPMGQVTPEEKEEVEQKSPLWRRNLLPKQRAQKQRALKERAPKQKQKERANQSQRQRPTLWKGLLQVERQRSQRGNQQLMAGQKGFPEDKEEEEEAPEVEEDGFLENNA